MESPPTDDMDVEEDLDVNIALAREDLALASATESPELSELARAHSVLGLYLLIRYQHSGQLRDVEEACVHDRRALDITPPDDDDMVERKAALAVDLDHIYRFRTADIDLEEEAINLMSQALEMTSIDDEEWATRQYNLGTYLHARYLTDGKIESLREAISRTSSAVDAAQVEDEDFLMELAALYECMYAHDGRVENLDKAIGIGRRAVAIAPNKSIALVRAQTTLGSSLQTRYLRTGNSDDLEACIALERSAIKLSPPGHADTSPLQSRLGASLWLRYLHTQEQTDLEAAIDLERAALKSSSPDQMNYAVHNANLGKSLVELYEITSDLSHLNEAIALEWEAVRVHPTHPWRPWWQSSLATSLISRFDSSHNMDDLHEAVNLSSSAATDTPPTSLDFPAVQLQFAQILMKDAEVRGDNQRLPEATAGLLAGMHATHTLPNVRIQPALELAKLAWSRGTHDVALEAYQEVMELLPQVLWLGMGIADRIARSEQLNLAAISADAAACCLDANEPEKAVEMLEQGRSMLWSQSLSLQADVTALHQSNQVEVAERFITLSNRLSSWNALLDEQRAADADEGHQLTAQWTALIKEIRDLQGFHQFLGSKSFEFLSRAASNGPIVIFNASRYRCDAITITPNGHVVVIPLSKLTVDIIHQEQSTHRSRSSGHRPIVFARREVGHSLRQWLWSNIMHPVYISLSKLDTELDRVWLCPTGPFTFLPLHIAGPDDMEEPGFIDLVLPSYTPTISALLRAQDRYHDNRGGPFTMLAVGLTEAPGLSPLPQTANELRLIRQYVPNESLLTLQDSEATVKKVTVELPNRSWVHFCCHGHQDTANQPLKSSLHLYDGNLQISDLMQVNIKPAEFAFLSACQTAAGGEPKTTLNLI
jgi:tetratricopeptide (TPR) repeat protein